MRAYFFGNMYLSSIQQGIQAAHAVAAMYTKYLPLPHRQDPGDVFSYDDEAAYLTDWAENHETMILLNAGYSSTIHELCEFFQSMDNPYPWSAFYEGKDALDGALTTVGIILPEDIYEGAAVLRNVRITAEILREEGLVTLNYGKADERTIYPTKWQAELMGKLNQFGLAK